MCLYPQFILNRKYLPNKKNGGKPPLCVDERVKYVPVGCGKCMECAKQKQRNWQIRLLEEIKERKDGQFITLTFSNEQFKNLVEGKDTKGKKICKPPEEKGYELDNWIAKTAVRRFLERWRKKYKKSVRHWLVTELGHQGTENIHLHGIIFTDKSKEEIEEIWEYGYTWNESEKRKVGEDTVNYIIKYIGKTDKDHPNYTSKVLTSSGIGKRYIKSENFKNNKYKEKGTNTTYRTRTGHKINLNNYYRNKAYSEEEREKLWLEMLDKNERWIGGEKVKADDAKSIEKLQEWHRERSVKLGYPNILSIWKKKEYEEIKRVLTHKKRLGEEVDWTQLNKINENIKGVERNINTLEPNEKFWSEQGNNELY